MGIVQYSNISSNKSESESCSVMSNSLWPHRLYSPWNSPGQNTGVSSLFLLQGIFPTQGSNPCLSHCRGILYQLSHKESPRILKWVAYPFSSGSSQPRNQTGVSCIAGGFLPTELSGKPHWVKTTHLKKKKDFQETQANYISNTIRKRLPKVIVK